MSAAAKITHAAALALQRALLTLLRDGWVDKVVRAARRVYAERAPRVAAALSPYAELAGPLAGMYSTWLLPEPTRCGPGTRPVPPASSSTCSAATPAAAG